MEMFPSVGRPRIAAIVAQGVTVEGAVDILLKPSNTITLLKEQREMIMTDSYIELEMSRACIANKAKAFYKSCLHSPSQLRKSLHIQFRGEPGIDAGALKNDFFIGYFRCVKDELFEGAPNRLTQVCARNTKPKRAKGT